jgi:hypothetical protein
MDKQNGIIEGYKERKSALEIKAEAAPKTQKFNNEVKKQLDEIKKLDGDNQHGLFDKLADTILTSKFEMNNDVSKELQAELAKLVKKDATDKEKTSAILLYNYLEEVNQIDSEYKDEINIAMDVFKDEFEQLELQISTSSASRDGFVSS